MTTETAVEALLARSVDSVTVPADPDAVIRQIDARRAQAARRHRTRTTMAGVGAAAAALAVVALAAIGTRDGVSSIDAAGPPTSAASRTTVGPTTPGPPAVQTVQLPGRGDSATPLGGDATGFWVSRGTPATVTRVERDGTVGASTRLQGSARFAAADPAHLWLLVEEPEAGARPYRLKQIDRSDGALLASHEVALEGAPTGLEVRGDSILASWGLGVVELDRAGTLRSSTPRWAVDARQQVTTGETSWTLAQPVDGTSTVRSVAPSGATATTEIDGARRLVAVPALDPGVVAIERVVGDRVQVEARRVADDPAPTPLATLEPDQALAWATPEEVWVLDGPRLERRPR